MKTDTVNKQDEALNGDEVRDCPDSTGSPVLYMAQRLSNGNYLCRVLSPCGGKASGVREGGTLMDAMINAQYCGHWFPYRKRDDEFREESKLRDDSRLLDAMLEKGCAIHMDEGSWHVDTREDVKEIFNLENK